MRVENEPEESDPPAATSGAVFDQQAIFALERPDRALLRYYILFSLLFGPLMPIVLVPLWLRFRTLRYRFDDAGISMRWGALRRREVNLAYARIQDIHLTSNAIERWLGLARIQIQTASGSQKAEVTIEGVPRFEALRSFLVERMRSERGGVRRPAREGTGAESDDALLGQVVVSLAAVTHELRALRARLADGVERPRGEGDDP